MRAGCKYRWGPAQLTPWRLAETPYAGQKARQTVSEGEKPEPHETEHPTAGCAVRRPHEKRQSQQADPKRHTETATPDHGLRVLPGFAIGGRSNHGIYSRGRRLFRKLDNLAQLRPVNASGLGSIAIQREMAPLSL
jgi:hypothetical protein